MALLVIAVSGCSIKKMAMNKLGDALAAGGTTFAADDDPELIKSAAPFSLKLMESILAENPRHRGLLFAAASGFTQYAYAFVQQEADEIEETDFTTSREMRQRARKLYLRARDYALRGLELAHPGFSNALRADAVKAVKVLTKEDVPLAYWAAASWAGAVAVIKNNADLIAELPLVEALIDRALALDESYESGAIHSLLIAYEMARKSGQGESARRARAHFDRVVELTGGRQVAPYVSLAENVAIEQQNAKEFETLLNQALSIDPNARPEWRLANVVMQRRARWLLQQKNNLIAVQER